MIAGSEIGGRSWWSVAGQNRPVEVVPQYQYSCAISDPVERPVRGDPIPGIHGAI